MYYYYRNHILTLCILTLQFCSFCSSCSIKPTLHIQNLNNRHGVIISEHIVKLQISSKTAKTAKIAKLQGGIICTFFQIHRESF